MDNIKVGRFLGHSVYGRYACVPGAVNVQQQIVSVGNTVRLTCDGVGK